MNMKRLITAVIGLPLVILLIIFGNKYVIDAVIAIIGVMAMYEYSKCISQEAKLISWVGYLSAISIAFIHIVSDTVLSTVITLGVPIILFILYILDLIKSIIRINLFSSIFIFILF